MHRRFSTGLFLAICFICSPKVTRAESVGYIPNGGVYLAKGFDILFPEKNFPLCIKSSAECQTGVKDAITCLAGNAPSQIQFGETTSFSIKQIHSKSEFFHEVNISASLSASYGPFSGSGSFSSSALDQINQDSLSWMVSAKGYYGSFALREPAVTQQDSKLSATQLVEKCGPQYVSSVERGVAAVALFTVYNLDEQHRRVIQASMSAGFSTGAFGANAGATFADVMNTALQYGSMSINVFTIGGAGDPQLKDLVMKKPTDLEGVKQVLTDYVALQDPARSAIVGFKTTGFGKLVNNPAIDPDQSNYLYFLESANDYRLEINDHLSKVSGLLDREADFPSTTVASAKSDRTSLQCEQEYISLAIQTCRLSTDLVRRSIREARAESYQSAS